MSKLTLQEQMLKAGLVSQKKLSKVKKGAKKSRVQAREAKEAVEANKIAQIERDKQLNQQLKEQQLSKELRAQIKQLIEMNKLDLKNGDIKYNFVDGTVIKSLYVEELMRKQLLGGLLSIARYNDGYVVIPTIVAKKIELRDANSVVETKVPEQEVIDEDDPYKDFVVPDDLMW